MLSDRQFSEKHPDKKHLITDKFKVLNMWDIVHVVEIWNRDDGNALVHLEGRGWSLMKSDGHDLLLKFDHVFAAKSKYYDYNLTGHVDRKADEVFAKKKALSECRCTSLWIEHPPHSK
jgi:hypothetical protein